MTTIYLIRYADTLDKSDDTSLWWSHENDSWAPLDEASVFTAAQVEQMGGWVGGEIVPFTSTTTLDEHAEQAINIVTP